jgi:hypothetical protein
LSNLFLAEMAEEGGIYWRKCGNGGRQNLPAMLAEMAEGSNGNGVSCKQHLRDI